MYRVVALLLGMRYLVDCAQVGKTDDMIRLKLDNVDWKVIE